VKIDSLVLQMRPRAPHEAADLGIRLCQTVAGDVYRCYFVVAIPMMILALSLFEVAHWIPMWLIWWSKPWMDRTILFVLGRAAFGQQTRPADLWREQREVWWRQFLLMWTWRRLSPWRSFTQPVYQLEGQGFFRMRQRVLQLRRRHTGAAFMMTQAFAWAETGFTFGILILAFMFSEPGGGFDVGSLIDGEAAAAAQVISTVAYALVVLFIEPFYVAAGFGMYLNRRAELEAWDIEQEFRRAFAT
jgi:hypothetical protein